MRSDQPSPTHFDERRLGILAAVAERSPVLATYYKSAIDQLSTQPETGDERIRVSLICHAIRELINSLPWAMGTTSSQPIKPSSKTLLESTPSWTADLEGDDDMVPAPRQVVTWLAQFVRATELENKRVRDDLVALLADTPQEDHPLATPWNQTRSWFVRWAHFERGSGESGTIPSDETILEHLQIVEDVIQARTAAFFDAREAIDDVLAQANASEDEGDAPG